MNGGKIAYIQNGSNWNYIVTGSVHEIGHNMGLEHVDAGGGNFMNYDNNRTYFSSLQILQMFHRSKYGALNQGSNSERSMQNTNNWIYHTSTNEAPWFKNTRVGERIPKIIKTPK